MIRGPRFDLSRARLRRQLLDEVQRGQFALVVASPPCSTFSRARYSGRPGPPPLRSAEFLRGFPRLNGRNRDRIARANLFVDFSVELLQAQAAGRRWGLLEHPEDLGARRAGIPGSIWRWPAVRALVEHPGWTTGALLQSAWGRAFAKPTRFVTSLPGFSSSLFPGWPEWDEAGRYTGPLPRGPAEEQLIGFSDGVFRATGAAAWPSLLC